MRKKMEEDEGLWTVESLRGRLLAERAATKAAKENEQFMASKLKELEVQLRRETKAMNKFEKKLRFLTNRLQALSVSDSDESAGRFSSSDASESSCISSAASTDQRRQDSQANQEDPLHETPHMDDKSADQESTCTGLKAQMKEEEDDDGEKEDKSMALVAVNNIPSELEGRGESSEKEEMKISSESVRDLLSTLKNIREEIKSTMQQRRPPNRQMIRTR